MGSRLGTVEVESILAWEEGLKPGLYDGTRSTRRLRARVCQATNTDQKFATYLGDLVEQKGQSLDGLE